jgi:ribose transport system permease protein
MILDAVGAWLRKMLLFAHRWRLWVLCAAVFAVMSIMAPNFAEPGNFANVVKGAGTALPAAIGFTLVLLAGQLDLSVGSAMTMGGMLVMGLAPRLGWARALAVAAAAGCAQGLANGLLVSKAKINSFIVTLGTMLIVYNAMAIYSHGGTIPAPKGDYTLSDRLQYPVVGPAFAPRPGQSGWAGAWLTLWLTPRNFVAIALLAAAWVVLRLTPVGRGFYLLGGNRQAAWYSGLSVDWYIIGAFVISAGVSAFGGAMVAMSEAAGSLEVGDRSLMTIVAAVIIGGTSMEGGKGSVVGSAVALVALTALTNGLDCLGAGYEVNLMSSGLVLAMVILYDAIWLHMRRRKMGQRKDLLAELTRSIS